MWLIHVSNGPNCCKTSISKKYAGTDGLDTGTKDNDYISIVHKWLTEGKKSTDTSKGKSFICQRKGFILKEGKVYLQVTLKRCKEKVCLFIIPCIHWTSVLNGCHWNTRHQGQERTLLLIQEKFWWPSCEDDVRSAIRHCVCCQQHKKQLVKAPMTSIMATALMELLHVDFTSMEKTMALNEQPRWYRLWWWLTISHAMPWHLWLLIRWQRPSQKYFMKITSLYLVLQQRYSPIEEPVLPACW